MSTVFPSKGPRVRVPQSAPFTPRDIGFYLANTPSHGVTCFTLRRSKRPYKSLRILSQGQRRGQLPKLTRAPWAGFPGTSNFCLSSKALLKLCSDFHKVALALKKHYFSEKLLKAIRANSGTGISRKAFAESGCDLSFFTPQAAGVVARPPYNSKQGR